MIHTWRGFVERRDQARERVDAVRAFAGELPSPRRRCDRRRRPGGRRASGGAPCSRPSGRVRSFRAAWFTFLPASCARAAATMLSGVKPNLRLQVLERRRCAERSASRSSRRCARRSAPSRTFDGLLDGDARRDGRRQHAVAIRGVLLLEQLPRRHATPRAPARRPRRASRAPRRTARPRCRCRSGSPRGSAACRRARRRPCAAPRPARTSSRSSVGIAWRVSTSTTGWWRGLGDELPRLGDLVRVARAQHDQRPGSRAATRGARSAGASGRPRRRRSSRA